MANKLKVTQTRSIIGSQQDKHKVVMESLGFRKHQRTLYKNDNPQIRGMLHKVRHLVTWEEVDEKDIPAAAEKNAGYTVIGTGAKAKEQGKDEAE